MSAGEFPALTIRQSLKARRLRIVVRPEAVELVIPRGGSEREALRFLEQNKIWVLSKLEEVRKRVKAVPEKPMLIAEDGTIPFQGVRLTAKELKTSGQRLRVRLMAQSGFEFLVPEGQSPSEDLLKAGLFAAIRPWMESAVRQQIEGWVGLEGMDPRMIRIKRMRSRWGSCGPRGDINLNWILAFMPPEILEYVVFHELCHLRHRDHSAAFWSLVATRIPDWRRRRDWLKREGAYWIARFG